MQRDSFEEAERCEQSHLSALSVRELEYKFGPYPFRVVLVFPDGKEREYISDDGIYYETGVNYANNKDKGKSK